LRKAELKESAVALVYRAIGRVSSEKGQIDGGNAEKKSAVGDPEP